MPLLFIFDKDGTLIKGMGLTQGRIRNSLKPEEQMLKPRVFEKIQQLRAAGHVIALASNQTAVARGLITPEEATVLMDNVAAKIGGVAAWRCCCFDPKAPETLHGQLNPWARDDPNLKPHPGMIVDLMQTLGFTPEQTFMVGNSKIDRQAAAQAGVSYLPARSFFKNL